MLIRQQFTGIANFIYEVISLKRIRRSSYQTLGPHQGTIAEHSFVTAVIGYCLAKIENVDSDKVMKMCLFHDLIETRTGDANFVHKRYQLIFENVALADMLDSLPLVLKTEIGTLQAEFNLSKTKEATIAHEADKLEQLFEEILQLELGNSQAKKWIEYSLSKLSLNSSQELAKVATRTNSWGWWQNMHQKKPINETYVAKIISLVKSLRK